LADIDRVREDLNCSRSGAWFRGHEDTTFKLLPSLYRLKHKSDPDYHKEYEILKAPNKRLSELRKKALDLRPKLKSRSPDLEKTYAKILSQISIEKEKAKLNAPKLRRLELTPDGERDAYIEYCFRAGQRYHSSWEALSEMQHYRIPTRLLDWTETLAVALFFALKLYDAKLDEYWLKFFIQEKKQRKIKSSPECNQSTERFDKKYSLPFYLPDKLPVPSIWVANPYLVSRILLHRKEFGMSLMTKITITNADL
jgi:hypothetical protein